MCTHLHIQHIFQPFITEKSVIVDLEQVFLYLGDNSAPNTEKQMSNKRRQKQEKKKKIASA